MNTVISCILCFALGAIFTFVWFGCKAGAFEDNRRIGEGNWFEYQQLRDRQNSYPPPGTGSTLGPYQGDKLPCP